MGYVLLWTILLTAIAVSCSIPIKVKFKKIIKGYLIAFWTLPIIVFMLYGILCYLLSIFNEEFVSSICKSHRK